MFERWGFSIIDSEYLQREFVDQAKLAYLVGDYELGKLDKYGQRITINIDLNGTTIKTGWMLLEKGIRLLTPFSGFFK